MNEAAAHPPMPRPPARNEAPAAAVSPDPGWSRRKIYGFIAVVLLAYVAFIFIFGTKKPIVPRAVGPGPQLQMADSANELIALDDPTLLALPHANDFVSAVWQHPQTNHTRPSFGWTGPTNLLDLPQEKLGSEFNEFMRTNPVASLPLNLKTEPEFSATDFAIDPALPQNSTLRITGPLAARRLLQSVTVPSLTINDVITPSRVQVLVAKSGDVVSAVVLPSDDPLEMDSQLAGAAGANQRALELARQLRFAPAPELMLGRIIFTWHTVPTNTP
jgi:hypothetical protein